MQNSMEALLRQKCRDHNLRVTPQRISIFKIVQGSKDHPNADVVFRKVRKLFSNISFDTVNRTLITFAKMGFLNVVEGYGCPKRFDPDTNVHHHFHCIQCNRIIDFQEAAYNAIIIPETIAKQCIVTDKKVVLMGLCDKCKQ